MDILLVLCSCLFPYGDTPGTGARGVGYAWNYSQSVTQFWQMRESTEDNIHFLYKSML